MADRRHPRPADLLALDAMLYAGGEMPAADSAAFERQLADDQGTRDALANAVQITLALTGRPQRPDPAYRQRVRESAGKRGWWGWLSKPRIRRGPAVAWVGLGTAAAVAFMALPGWFDRDPIPTEPAAIAVEPQSVVEPVVALPPAPEQVVKQPEVVEPMDAKTAAIWEEMSDAGHLQRFHEEEQRRRAQRSREAARRVGESAAPAGDRILGNSRGGR